MAYFYATIYERHLSLEWLLKTEIPGKRRENKRLRWQGDLTFSHSFLSKVSSLTPQLCRVHQSWNSNTFTLNMQSSKIQNQKNKQIQNQNAFSQVSGHINMLMHWGSPPKRTVWFYLKRKLSSKIKYSEQNISTLTQEILFLKSLRNVAHVGSPPARSDK